MKEEWSALDRDILSNENADQRDRIRDLQAELRKMTQERDAFKAAAAHWAAASERTRDWGVNAIEAVAAAEDSGKTGSEAP